MYSDSLDEMAYKLCCFIYQEFDITDLEGIADLLIDALDTIQEGLEMPVVLARVMLHKP